MSKSTSYVITSAGQYEGTMAACRIPVRTTRYATVEAAERDIAMVREGSTEELLETQVSVHGEDGWYVYASQEDADRDQDGSRAIAVIERAPTMYGFELWDGERWTTEGIGEQNTSNYLTNRSEAQREILNLAEVLGVDTSALRVVEVVS